MATMTGYESYLYKVLPDISGCPPIVAEDKIREAVIELCHRTSIWRKTIPAFYLSENVPSYELLMEDYEQLAQVRWGYLTDDNGQRIDLNVTSEDTLDAGSAKGWRALVGVPEFVFMLSPETIQFASIPNARFAASIGASIKPTQDSFEAPSFIFNQYIDVIAAGAKAKLLDMKGQSWYDPASARKELDKFNNMVGDARSAVNRGHNNQPKLVKMRPIA
jgi:hypothetical protein